MTESETLMNTVKNTHEWSLACVIVSHFHWHKKQIVCSCLEGWRCSNSFAWLRAAIWPSSSLHLSPLLQDVWIVYLSVRPGLGKATARASADWCRSTAPPAVISVTVRSSSGNGSRSPGGRKKKEDRESFLSIEQHKELLWTVCQWSNGSQQVQPCRAALEVFKGLICREITLGAGRVCVLFLESGSVSERSHSRAATCRLLSQWGLLYTSVTHQTTASVGLLWDAVVQRSPFFCTTRSGSVLTITAPQTVAFWDFFVSNRGTVWREARGYNSWLTVICSSLLIGRRCTAVENSWVTPNRWNFRLWLEG